MLSNEQITGNDNFSIVTFIIRYFGNKKNCIWPISVVVLCPILKGTSCIVRYSLLNKLLKIFKGNYIKTNKSACKLYSKWTTSLKSLYLSNYLCPFSTRIVGNSTVWVVNLRILDVQMSTYSGSYKVGLRSKIAFLLSKRMNITHHPKPFQGSLDVHSPPKTPNDRQKK